MQLYRGKFQEGGPSLETEGILLRFVAEERRLNCRMVSKDEYPILVPIAIE